MIALAPDLALLHSGKVRDTYDLGGGLLLMVASDRISAFDVVLPTPIPEKGRVLAGLSAWWFRRLRDVAPNHLVGDLEDGAMEHREVLERFAGRAMIVRRAERLPYECVVRGYLAGSGWLEYRECGTLAGEAMPSGLREGAALSAPQFTPARKSDAGHDENISGKFLRAELGNELAGRLEAVSLRLFDAARARLAQCGLILADTKLEFGFVDGELTLIDEAFTPDSSRLWLAEEHRPGDPQPSLDKQPVRDWLDAQGWDRVSPPSALPPEVVAATTSRYREAYRRTTGGELAPEVTA